MVSKLAEFYDGKTIFLTGASGFVGMMFLDILLRCFPNIKCIYALLRSKKGLTPEQRKEKIFKSWLLIRSFKDRPELIEKVQVIAGDLKENNLAISEEDKIKICNEVTIVFHFGASVTFDNSYRTAAITNSKGTQQILKFCKMIKKLEAFIYTSTAYSNTHKYPEKIEEKVYELPVTPERFLEELENGTEESFKELVFSTGFQWPNSYAFSKCLAENILLKQASDLPTVIIRPSVIIQPCKGPNAGYLVSGEGFQDCVIGVVKGVVKVMPGSYQTCLDVIPVDVVTNLHIISAWAIATGRLPRFTVINNTSNDSSIKFYIGDHLNYCAQLAFRNKPIPTGFQTPSIKVIKNKLLYNLLHFYEEFLPCLVLDLNMRLSGRKPKYMRMIKRSHHLLGQLFYFTSREIEFYSEKFHLLTALLDPDDKEMMYTEIKDLTYEDIMDRSLSNSPLFDPKFDHVSPKKRRYIFFKRMMIITFARRFSIFLFVCMMYLIFKLLY